MDDTQMTVEPNEPSIWDKHCFSLFVVLSILISCVLVLVSMAIYNNSGAAQLDLSRPGYVSVRAQAVNNDGDFQNYSNTGPINQDSINEFKLLYNQQAQKTKVADAFSGDPLSPDALGINTTTLD